MDTKLLRKMATAAIQDHDPRVSPFPSILIRSPNPINLEITPFTGLYHGFNDGLHQYQLEAEQVIRVVDRYELEFQLGGKRR